MARREGARPSRELNQLRARNKKAERAQRERQQPNAGAGSAWPGPKEDVLPAAAPNRLHQPMVYRRRCSAGCTGEVATCDDFYHRSVGGLNFFGDDHQDFDDVVIWEALVGDAWYRVGAAYNIDGHVWVNFFPSGDQSVDLFKFGIRDVPDAKRLLRKRDRSATCRERIDAEIRELLSTNLDRAFDAAATHYAGQVDDKIAPFLELAPDVRAMIRHIEVLKVVGAEAVLAEASDTHRFWAGADENATYVVQEQGAGLGPTLYMLPNEGGIVDLSRAEDLGRANDVTFTTIDDDSHPELLLRFHVECERKWGGNDKRWKP